MKSQPIAVGNGGYKMTAVYNGALMLPLLDTRATWRPGESVGARRGGEASALPVRGGGFQREERRSVRGNARRDDGRGLERVLAGGGLPHGPRPGGAVNLRGVASSGRTRFLLQRE